MAPPAIATARSWCRFGTIFDSNSDLESREKRRSFVPMDRRDFLKAALSLSSTGLLAPKLWAFDVTSVENPLGVYPSRGWEQVYRDQYRYDSTFTWVCAPNDTHMCRLRAFVRNGIF